MSKIDEAIDKLEKTYKELDSIKLMKKQITHLKAKNKRLQITVAFLNSMILGGEKHSNTSRKMVEQALKDPK